MSIWISRPGFLAAPLLLALTGCAAGPDVGKANFGISRNAPKSIAVADKSIVIAGPPGYCIDRAGSRLNGGSAFVLLASCASISRRADAGAPSSPGILTASVARATSQGPSLGASLGTLEAFVASPAGRAALARDGRAESVEILDIRREAGALMIRLRDTSQGAMSGMEDVYWRGLSDVNGRLVAVSMLSFSDRPLPKEAGLATLWAFLTRIRAETPAQIAET